MKVEFPLRIGRKEKRVVLDREGIEVVIFPKGMECYASFFCEVLNGNVLEDAFDAGVNREASFEMGNSSPDFNEWVIGYLKNKGVR